MKTLAVPETGRRERGAGRLLILGAQPARARHVVYRPAQDLLGTYAVQTLRGSVPIGDAGIGVHGDNGVLHLREYTRLEVRPFIRLPALRDVPCDHGEPAPASL